MGGGGLPRSLHSLLNQDDPTTHPFFCPSIFCFHCLFLTPQTSRKPTKVEKEVLRSWYVRYFKLKQALDRHEQLMLARGVAVPRDNEAD
jgi:hypothetical protein